MIFTVIFLILPVVLLLGGALFTLGPILLESLIDSVDDWREVFERIRKRRANR